MPMWSSIDPEAAIAAVYAVFGVLFGAATGSFIGVVLDRVPRGESLGGRSRCVCGRQLPAYENVPVFAWLALRGRARCCGARIPGWFLLVEVLTAAWCAAAGWFFAMPGVVVAALVAVAAAYAVARSRR